MKITIVATGGARIGVHTPKSANLGKIGSIGNFFLKRVSGVDLMQIGPIERFLSLKWAFLKCGYMAAVEISAKIDISEHFHRKKS